MIKQEREEAAQFLETGRDINAEVGSQENELAHKARTLSIQALRELNERDQRDIELEEWAERWKEYYMKKLSKLRPRAFIRIELLHRLGVIEEVLEAIHGKLKMPEEENDNQG